MYLYTYVEIIYANACLCTSIHMHIKYMCVCMHNVIYVSIYTTYMLAYIQTYMHKHIHSDMHTHTD